jgi:hypothetical protein
VVLVVVTGRAVVVVLVVVAVVAVDAWLVVVPGVVVPVVLRALVELLGVVMVALVQRPDTHTCPAGQSAVVWHEPGAVVVVRNV